MTISSKDQRPSRRIPGSIIEGRDLSRLIGIPEDELVRMANQAHLPFSFSTNVGVWIRARDLPAWQTAARTYRG
jgi:hypothetical protein